MVVLSQQKCIYMYIHIGTIIPWMECIISLSMHVFSEQGLSMVLAKDQLDVQIEEPMEVDENPSVTAIPTHKWLLEQLPSLPQFTAVKPQACAALRQVRQTLYLIIHLHKKYYAFCYLCYHSEILLVQTLLCH